MKKQIFLVIVMGALLGAAFVLVMYQLIRFTVAELGIDFIKSIQQQNSTSDVGTDQ